MARRAAYSSQRIVALLSSGRRRSFWAAAQRNATTNPAQRVGTGDAMTTSPMRSVHTHDATGAPRHMPLLYHPAGLVFLDLLKAIALIS